MFEKISLSSHYQSIQMLSQIILDGSSSWIQTSQTKKLL